MLGQKKGTIHKKYPLLLKKKIAEEVITEVKEAEEAARDYGVPSYSVRRWVRQYGAKVFKEKTKEVISSPVMKETLKKKQPALEKQIRSLEEENLLLRKKLLESDLQREALNTLIDLAEENYGISLRKNSGAKQSTD
jgi:transposase-like protein